MGMLTGNGAGHEHETTATIIQWSASIIPLCMSVRISH